MVSVAIYVRISREDIDKMKGDDSKSIANQKSMLSTYCKERNWDIYDIYCDDGFSGMDKNRPEFNRMIDDCESGKVNMVLCKDQSRFSRDATVIDSLLYDKFIELGVRFKGVSDNSDNENDTGMRLFTSAFNEFYVQDISKKVRKTLEHKREQGQFTGSFAPYGYQLDPDDRHHLAVDKEAAVVVRDIFQRFADGNSYRLIVMSLNERKILSPTAYKESKGSNFVCCNLDRSNSKGLWTQSTIEKILKDEVYIGTLVQGKSHPISHKNKKRKKVPKEDWIRTYEAHEPIISAELWEKVQTRIKSRVRSSRITQTLSPLSGKVKCAVCGRPMKRNIYHNKKKTITYYNLQCASNKTGAMNCSNVHGISGLKLEKTILNELNEMIKVYCEADTITIENTAETHLEALNNRLNDLNMQKQKISIRLEGIYTDKLDGLITPEEYSRYRDKFNAEIKALDVECEKVTANINKCKNFNEDSESRSILIHQYTDLKELTKRVADEFIDTVIIGELNENGEREIQVNWKV